MKKGMVSIVIPIVRNDIHVKGCVDAISNSTYKNVEILVVDEGLERSAQRNIGIKKATGEYLLWLDSDMRIHPEVLQNCIRKITCVIDSAKFPTYHSVVGIYIPERIVTEGWFGKLRDWERQFYNGTLVDVLRFCRLEDAPLFDETLHGVEDSDWERQLIKKVHETKRETLVCDYPVYHHDQCGVIKWFKKKAYYARCLGAYKRKNPDDQLLTFRYRCVQIFVENGKWKRLIRRPHYAIGVMISLLIRGIIFHVQKRRYR